jgi:CubicO group peptidase (beta-lactamase class C family)
MKKFAFAIGIVAAAVLAFALLRRDAEPEPEPVRITITPGPPQPRVSLAEAGIDPQVIEAAVQYAGARNTRALVVGRGGHIVFEKYWGETSAETPVQLSGFTPVLASLLVGTGMNDRLIRDLDAPVSEIAKNLADDPRAGISPRQLMAQYDAETAADVNTLARTLEQALGGSYDSLVAERLWKPLGAGDFSLAAQREKGNTGTIRADCCFTARIGDWMRLGELLANDGVFAGNQFTPPRYVHLMLSPARKDAPHGFFTRVDGQFAAHDVAWLEAEGKQRMWIVPSLRLVILRVGDEPPSSQGFDEAMIPDSIIRGTSGWEPARAGESAEPKMYAPH